MRNHMNMNLILTELLLLKNGILCGARVFHNSCKQFTETEKLIEKWQDF